MASLHKDIIDLKFKAQNLKMSDFLFISVKDEDVAINIPFMIKQGTQPCG